MKKFVLTEQKSSRHRKQQKHQNASLTFHVIYKLLLWYQYICNTSFADDDQWSLHRTDMTLHYLFGEIIVAILIAIGISSLNIHAMQLQVKVISIEQIFENISQTMSSWQKYYFKRAGWHFKLNTTTSLKYCRLIIGFQSIQLQVNRY